MSALLVSVVSVLTTPNLDSPANIDAKKLFSWFFKNVIIVLMYLLNASNYELYVKKNAELAVLRANEKVCFFPFWLF